MSEARSAPLRVLVVAGYPALRAGLAALLAQESDLEPVNESMDDPDVIIADAGSLSDNALDDLADRYPGSPLVLIGDTPGFDDRDFLTYPGAYLPADVDGPALAAAVRAVAYGLTVIAPGHLDLVARETEMTNVDDGLLTPREREVLALIAEGLPNKAIARELGISEHTAKFHVGSVLGKLGASSRAEAVMLATRRGLLSI